MQRWEYNKQRSGLKSLQQDYETFLVGNPNLSLYLPLLLGRGHTQIICLISCFSFFFWGGGEEGQNRSAECQCFLFEI